MQKTKEERLWMRVEGEPGYHLFSVSGPRFIPKHPGWKWNSSFELEYLDLRTNERGPGRCLPIVNPSSAVQCPLCRSVHLGMAELTAKQIREKGVV